jgi:hypothetical protein
MIYAIHSFLTYDYTLNKAKKTALLRNQAWITTNITIRNQHHANKTNSTKFARGILADFRIGSIKSENQLSK